MVGIGNWLVAAGYEVNKIGIGALRQRLPVYSHVLIMLALYLTIDL